MYITLDSVCACVVLIIVLFYLGNLEWIGTSILLRSLHILHVLSIRNVAV